MGKYKCLNIQLALKFEPSTQMYICERFSTLSPLFRDIVNEIVFAL